MVIKFKKISAIVIIAVIIVLAIILLFPPGSTERIVPPGSSENIDHPSDDQFYPPSRSAMVDKDGFYSEYRLERERIRGRQIEVLQEVLNSKILKESQPEAAQRLVQITADIEKELQIEGIIKSQGYAECIAIVQMETALIVIPDEPNSLELENEMIESVEKITGYSEDSIDIVFRKQL